MRLLSSSATAVDAQRRRNHNATAAAAAIATGVRRLLSASAASPLRNGGARRGRPGGRAGATDDEKWPESVDLSVRRTEQPAIRGRSVRDGRR